MNGKKLTVLTVYDLKICTFFMMYLAGIPYQIKCPRRKARNVSGSQISLFLFSRYHFNIARNNMTLMWHFYLLHWNCIFNFPRANLDLTLDENIWSCFIGGLPYIFVRVGFDQMVVQRFMAARTVQDAKRYLRLFPYLFYEKRLFSRASRKK